MNFLNETREAIKKSGHTETDVVFIGSEASGHQCTWERFEKLADFDYDSGFGAAEVATDLIIVFSDGMKMWRGEYDGSEWWEFGPRRDLRRPWKKPPASVPRTRWRKRATANGGADYR